MRTRTFLALGFLVILGGALYLSLSFPKQAKVMPLLVLIPGVLLALWNFVAYSMIDSTWESLIRSVAFCSYSEAEG